MEVGGTEMGTVLQFSHLLSEYSPGDPGSFASRASMIVWKLHVGRYMLRKQVIGVSGFVSPGGIWSGSAGKVSGWLDRDRRVLEAFDSLRGWS